MQSLSPGIYEQIINQEIDRQLKDIENKFEIFQDKIDEAESSKIIAQYVYLVLRQVLESVSGEMAKQTRIELGNSILDALIKAIEASTSIATSHRHHMINYLQSSVILDEAKMLMLIEKKQTGLIKEESVRPEISLQENNLFTGSAHEPEILSELRKEIKTADRIDFLVSFIKWTGLRLIYAPLKDFTDNGGRLRIITTSYMGATDFEAVEKLALLKNTEIKISYDTKNTRLHAKAYLFWRDNGFSSAYIGSSNISKSAMTEGLEWNLKLAEYDSADLIAKIRATFTSYWNNVEFRTYIENKDEGFLKRALKDERGGQEGEPRFLFDIEPTFFQKEVLEQLRVEREAHGHYRNLIVAATGTGKTVMSALDYRRCRKDGCENLLFVAHREEILKQSLLCFRGVLRDYNFGDLLVGGRTPEKDNHLFASIMSLNSKEMCTKYPSDFYDYIVIDEFHHAGAESYQELLAHFEPKVLLGLTATPERMDGIDVIEKYFNGRIAAETRLYDAIERKFLSPFNYFGISDSVNYQDIAWVDGGYDKRELENIYVLDDMSAKKRASMIAEKVGWYCTSIESTIGLGFCVSQKHAEFMSGAFNKMGIASDFLTAASNRSHRESVQQRLVKGDIKFIFTVDLFNEGVDIPELNTVLFLRPTQSLTVFLQQLGRGLRLHQDKEVLTVLDFVGQANKKYNYEEKFRLLLARTHRTVQDEIHKGFPHVPRGCSVVLEKKAQAYILQNIRDAINDIRNIRRKIRAMFLNGQKIDVALLFNEYNMTPGDVYKDRGSRETIASIVYGERLLECEGGLAGSVQKTVAAGLLKIAVNDSAIMLRFFKESLRRIKIARGEISLALAGTESRMFAMLYYTFFNEDINKKSEGTQTAEQILYGLMENNTQYDEIIQFLEYREAKAAAHLQTQTADADISLPFHLHCAYSSGQILAGVGKDTIEKKSSFREGVLYLPMSNLDAFFITINKSENDYSPSTLYHDYVINEHDFHWQSQSTTSASSITGQRYINQRENGNKVMLFVREYKTKGGSPMPYVCLGLADYVQHEGSSPINIVWRLHNPIPWFVMEQASVI